MKYVFYSDINYLNKNKKYFLFYFLLLIGYLFMKGVTHIPFNLSLFEQILGLNTTFSSDFLTILLTLFHICFFLFLTMLLFTKDFKEGVENIFLRMTPIKWFLVKMFNLFLITILLKLVLYLILSFLIKNPILEIQYFLHDIFYYFSLEIGFLCFYMFSLKYPFLLFIGLVLLIFNLSHLPLTILNTSLFVLLICCLFFLFLASFFLKNKYIFLFEKNR